MDAFNAVMKNHPDIKLLDAKYANWNRDDAFKVMQDYLTRFKQIDAIWAADDDMAVGVLKAIEQAKRNDIKIVFGGAGAKGMVKTIMDGKDQRIQADVSLLAQVHLRRDQADRRGAPEGREAAGHDDHPVGADHQGQRQGLLLPRTRRSDRRCPVALGVADLRATLADRRAAPLCRPRAMAGYMNDKPATRSLASCATPWSAAGATPSSARCTARRSRSTARSNWWPARCRRRPDKARASGRDLFLADDRNHGDWQALLADELKRPARRAHRLRLDRHAQPRALPGGAGLRRGRLPRGVRQAAGAHARSRPTRWSRRSRAQGTVFGVTYNYTGYPMVRQAREMVRAGELGDDPQGRRRIQPGLARHAARRRAATSRPTGAPTRRAAARPAPSATSARMPRTWSPPSPAWRSKACAPTSARWCRAARSTTTPACCCASTAARAACWSRRRSTPASRTTCACASPARSARSSGGRKSRASWCICPHRRADAHPHARLALAVRIGAARQPPAERPSRGLHRGLRQRLCAACRRTSARGSPAQRPTRWTPTIRAWRTARAACASSSARWPRRPARRKWTAW